MSVACVGDNCIDRYTAPVRLDAVGGNALNVAVRLARRGLPTAYLGAIGADAEGGTVAAALTAAGVDIDRLSVRAGQTGITIVELTEAGDRVFVEERLGVGVGYRPSPDEMTFLRSCEWVHAAGLSDPGQLACLHPSRMSYDFSQLGPGPMLQELAPILEVAFVSGAGMTRREAVELARSTVAAGARLAVVTRGREGSLAWNGRLVEQPAAPVEVVDTLGAGDALIAGVIAALVEGDAVDGALAAGGEAAALACSHYGAWQPA